MAALCSVIFGVGLFCAVAALLARHFRAAAALPNVAASAPAPVTTSLKVEEPVAEDIAVETFNHIYFPQREIRMPELPRFSARPFQAAPIPDRDAVEPVSAHVAYAMTDRRP